MWMAFPRVTLLRPYECKVRSIKPVSNKKESLISMNLIVGGPIGPTARNTKDCYGPRKDIFPTFWAFTSIWKNTEKPLAERRIFSFQQLSRSQEVFSRYQRCSLLTFFTIT